MHQIETTPGEHINQAASRLAAAADKFGAASLNFNDIEVVASKGMAADAIVADWHAKMDASRKAYQESPEGNAAARDRDARRSDAQRKHDALMRRLPQLDFGNDVAVIDWLCEMQEPSDHNGVIVRRKTILDAFAKHGFTPGVNCGPDFRPESRENVHRWLVGQALATLESVAIHGVVHKFASDWKAKFV